MTENYLLFCTTGLGDSLFVTPAIRFLRKQRPAANITVVVKRGRRNLFETNPHLSQLLDYRNNFAWRGLARWRIRRQAPYRAAFLFHVHEDVLDVLHGVAHERLYCLQNLKGLPAHAMRCQIDPANGRQWEDFAAMVAQEVGGNCEDFEFELPVTPASAKAAGDFFGQFSPRSGPKIGLQLGGSHLGKCWPPERFAALTSRLLAAYGGCVFINAIPGEQALVDQFTEALPPDARTHCHRLPRTSINGLAALLGKLDLFVSNDTGPLHVALSQNRPVIALKAHDDVTPPYTVPRETSLRRVIFERTEMATSGKEYHKSHRAMECITVDRVWSEVQPLLLRLGFSKVAISLANRIGHPEL
jgi:ADP-heptose:LPS heptosyltransferase